MPTFKIYFFVKDFCIQYMLVECRKLIRVTNDRRMIIKGVIKTYDEEKTF